MQSAKKECIVFYLQVECRNKLKANVQFILLRYLLLPTSKMHSYATDRF